MISQNATLNCAEVPGCNTELANKILDWTNQSKLKQD